MMSEAVWRVIRFQLVPFMFMLLFPAVALILPLWGKDGNFKVGIECAIGNADSWMIVVAFILWAVMFLKVPDEQYQPPTGDTDSAPVYQSNGMTYYCFTVGLFSIIISTCPKCALLIYNNMPAIIATLNVIALVFSAFLWWRGTCNAKERDPIVFEMYRGMEVHPRMWGMDVKQLTNCRIGLMGWQLLILAFWKASLQIHGWSPGIAVNVLLQTIYLVKFFWWEDGYFNTLDITLDRAGFYICWGCLVWVPSFYTFSTYYLVMNVPKITHREAVFILLVGTASIILNYLVDREKEIFKETKGRRGLFSNDPAVIEWRDDKTSKISYLLISGFWGTARHLNYTFELLVAFFWSVPGYHLGPPPFFYFIFLTCLLVHRTVRDETKCARKYGQAWKKYCKTVPYRMIPGVF